VRLVDPHAGVEKMKAAHGLAAKRRAPTMSGLRVAPATATLAHPTRPPSAPASLGDYSTKWSQAKHRQVQFKFFPNKKTPKSGWPLKRYRR